MLVYFGLNGLEFFCFGIEHTGSMQGLSMSNNMHDL